MSAIVIGLFVLSIEYSGRTVDASKFEDYMDFGQTVDNMEIVQEIEQIKLMEYKTQNEKDLMIEELQRKQYCRH